MPELKIPESKKIKIRELSPKDLKRAKDFLEYINSLIEEEAKILFNKKLSLKEEKEWLKNTLERIRKKNSVFCVAEDGRKIVGTAQIAMGSKRKTHVGELAISVRKEYRGMGVGKCLMETLLRLAKKKLKPKIIRLSVFENNKIAQNFYKKFGFKKVAKIPKQIQYKGKIIDEVVMILDLTKD